MAEEILVKETLSPKMISSGRALLSRLDAAGWRPSSALWLFDAEQNRWEMILASPDVEQRGPRPGYEIVRGILADARYPALALADVSIVPTRNEIVKALSLAVNVSGGSGVRMSRNAINGRYIEDAYIYRS